jgi:hypothetical protein
MRKTKTWRTNWLIAAAAATFGVVPVIAAPPDANNNSNTGQGVAGNSNLINGAPNATASPSATNPPVTPPVSDMNTSTNGNINIDNGIPRSDKAYNLALPAGFQQTEVTSASGIKSGLVKMADLAVTKGDFSSFLADLSVQDRQKAGGFNPDQSRLDSSIDRIQQAWKAKYNQSMDISDTNLVFNDQFTIIQGKVDDAGLAMANWPIAACNREQRASDISVNGNVSSVNGNNAAPYASSTDQQKAIDDDMKLTKGRDVALVRFPAGDGLPEMTVSMTFHNPLSWRVDVPRDRTCEQIYNDLGTQLDWMASHTEQWPASVDDAYRMVARHAAAALYGVGPTSATADIGH